MQEEEMYKQIMIPERDTNGPIVKGQKKTGLANKVGSTIASRGRGRGTVPGTGNTTKVGQKDTKLQPKKKVQ